MRNCTRAAFPRETEWSGLNVVGEIESLWRKLINRTTHCVISCFQIIVCGFWLRQFKACNCGSLIRKWLQQVRGIGVIDRSSRMNASVSTTAFSWNWESCPRGYGSVQFTHSYILTSYLPRNNTKSHDLAWLIDIVVQNSKSYRFLYAVLFPSKAVGTHTPMKLFKLP
jgi:hypothetical protein